MTPYLLAFALSQALDVGTSCAAFARGAYEANPIMPSTCGTMVATKVATTGAYTLLMHPLARKHPKLARVLTATLTGATLAIAVHNHQSGR